MGWLWMGGNRFLLIRGWVGFKEKWVGMGGCHGFACWCLFMANPVVLCCHCWNAVMVETVVAGIRGLAAYLGMYSWSRFTTLQ
jgi:hypothetical protein